MRVFSAMVWLGAVAALALGASVEAKGNQGGARFDGSEIRVGANERSGRYLPRRPGEERPSAARNENAARSGEREAPRRPGEGARYASVGNPDAGLRLQSEAGARYAPRRPGQVASGARDERLWESGYEWYSRIEDGAVPEEVGNAMPYVRDFEGTLERKAKKALWKKVVVVPVKVAFKTGKKVLWKGLVSSWLPVL